MILDSFPQRMEAELAAVAGGLNGVAGIVVHEVDSGVQAAWNAAEVFVAASLIKLPILWLFYAECTAGRLNPDEPYELQPADVVPGFGVLRSLRPGFSLRLRDLAALMIMVSDNTATNVLIDRLGMGAINETIRDLGLAQTVLARKMFDYSDPAKNNYTSPQDMVRMYRAIVDGGSLTPDYHAEMMQILLGQQCRNKLPSGLERGVKLAHKTGDLPQIEHDAGIFFGSRRRVIAVVMTKDLARNLDGVELCRRVGEIAHAYSEVEGGQT